MFKSSVLIIVTTKVLLFEVWSVDSVKLSSPDDHQDSSGSHIPDGAVRKSGDPIVETPIPLYNRFDFWSAVLAVFMMGGSLASFWLGLGVKIIGWSAAAGCLLLTTSVSYNVAMGGELMGGSLVYSANPTLPMSKGDGGVQELDKKKIPGLRGSQLRSVSLSPVSSPRSPPGSPGSPPDVPPPSVDSGEESPVMSEASSPVPTNPQSPPSPGRSSQAPPPPTRTGRLRAVLAPNPVRPFIPVAKKTRLPPVAPSAEPPPSSDDSSNATGEDSSIDDGNKSSYSEDEDSSDVSSGSLSSGSLSSLTNVSQKARRGGFLFSYSNLAKKTGAKKAVKRNRKTSRKTSQNRQEDDSDSDSSNAFQALSTRRRPSIANGHGRRRQNRKGRRLISRDGAGAQVRRGVGSNQQLTSDGILAGRQVTMSSQPFGSSAEQASFDGHPRGSEGIDDLSSYLEDYEDRLSSISEESINLRGGYKNAPTFQTEGGSHRPNLATVSSFFGSKEASPVKTSAMKFQSRNSPDSSNIASSPNSNEDLDARPTKEGAHSKSSFPKVASRERDQLSQAHWMRSSEGPGLFKFGTPQLAKPPSPQLIGFVREPPITSIGSSASIHPRELAASPALSPAIQGGSSNKGIPPVVRKEDLISRSPMQASPRVSTSSITGTSSSSDTQAISGYPRAAGHSAHGPEVDEGFNGVDFLRDAHQAHARYLSDMTHSITPLSGAVLTHNGGTADHTLSPKASAISADRSLRDSQEPGGLHNSASSSRLAIDQVAASDLFNGRYAKKSSTTSVESINRRKTPSSARSQSHAATNGWLSAFIEDSTLQDTSKAAPSRDSPKSARLSEPVLNVHSGSLPRTNSEPVGKTSGSLTAPDDLSLHDQIVGGVQNAALQSSNFSVDSSGTQATSNSTPTERLEGNDSSVSDSRQQTRLLDAASPVASSQSTSAASLRTGTSPLVVEKRWSLPPQAIPLPASKDSRKEVLNESTLIPRHSSNHGGNERDKDSGVIRTPPSPRNVSKVVWLDGSPKSSEEVKGTKVPAEDQVKSPASTEASRNTTPLQSSDNDFNEIESDHGLVVPSDSDKVSLFPLSPRTKNRFRRQRDSHTEAVSPLTSEDEEDGEFVPEFEGKDIYVAGGSPHSASSGRSLVSAPPTTQVGASKAKIEDGKSSANNQSNPTGKIQQGLEVSHQGLSQAQGSTRSAAASERSSVAIPSLETSRRALPGPPLSTSRTVDANAEGLAERDSDSRQAKRDVLAGAVSRAQEGHIGEQNSAKWLTDSIPKPSTPVPSPTQLQGSVIKPVNTAVGIQSGPYANKYRRNSESSISADGKGEKTVPLSNLTSSHSRAGSSGRSDTTRPRSRTVSGGQAPLLVPAAQVLGQNVSALLSGALSDSPVNSELRVDIRKTAVADKTADTEKNSPRSPSLLVEPLPSPKKSDLNGRAGSPAVAASPERIPFSPTFDSPMNGISSTSIDSASLESFGSETHGASDGEQDLVQLNTVEGKVSQLEKLRILIAEVRHLIVTASNGEATAAEEGPPNEINANFISTFVSGGFFETEQLESLDSQLKAALDQAQRVEAASSADLFDHTESALELATQIVEKWTESVSDQLLELATIIAQEVLESDPFQPGPYPPSVEKLAMIDSLDGYLQAVDRDLYESMQAKFRMLIALRDAPNMVYSFHNHTLKMFRGKSAQPLDGAEKLRDLRDSNCVKTSDDDLCRLLEDRMHLYSMILDVELAAQKILSDSRVETEGSPLDELVINPISRAAVEAARIFELFRNDVSRDISSFEPKELEHYISGIEKAVSEAETESMKEGNWKDISEVYAEVAKSYIDKTIQSIDTLDDSHKAKIQEYIKKELDQITEDHAQRAVEEIKAAFSEQNFGRALFLHAQKSSNASLSNFLSMRLFTESCT